MKGYLLDTDMVVFLLRNKYHIAEKLAQMNPEQIYISEVTVAELEYGNHCSGRYDENKRLLEMLLSQVNIVPFKEAIPLYAKERFRLKSIGQSIMDFDLLIACSSVARHLIMVTNNTKHFNRVQGIIIENWIEANEETESV